MIDELVRTSPSKLFATLDASGFDNFDRGDIFIKFWLAFLPENPEWALMDGRPQE